MTDKLEDRALGMIDDLRDEARTAHTLTRPDPEGHGKVCYLGADEDLLDRAADIVEQLLAEYRRLTTPKPKITITYDPPRSENSHPCARGLHQWAYITNDIFVCALCGFKIA